MSQTEPFIRWAGGKTWLIKYLDSILGKTAFNNYYEGGAAIFFSMDLTRNAYLSDTNGELIDTYISIRDFPEQVIESLLTFENTEEQYYQIRSQVPFNRIDQAARFIYLEPVYHLAFDGFLSEFFVMQGSADDAYSQKIC